MKFRAGRTLNEIKGQYKQEVDVAAEAARAMVLTPGAAQAMVYKQKQEEAIAYYADSDPQPGRYPHIEGEATRLGVSPDEVAGTFLYMANEWTRISVLIENSRLNAKDNIDRATTHAEVKDAAAVDWSNIMQRQ